MVDRPVYPRAVAILPRTGERRNTTSLIRSTSADGASSVFADGSRAVTNVMSVMAKRYASEVTGSIVIHR